MDELLRSLDREVAERVMGWKVSDDGLNWVRFGEMPAYRFAVDDSEFGVLWQPTVSFSQCELVIDEMVRRGYTWNFGVAKDQVWDWVTRSTDESGGSAHAPTLPHAICLAVRNAVVK